jgi:hypothetical protein
MRSPHVALVVVWNRRSICTKPSLTRFPGFALSGIHGGALVVFLVHLNDLDFYKGLDEQCEMCIALLASAGHGQHQVGAVCGDLAPGREHLTDDLGKPS